LKKLIVFLTILLFVVSFVLACTRASPEVPVPPSKPPVEPDLPNSDSYRFSDDFEVDISKTDPLIPTHSGTDLEVAYIERVPKYPRYDVDYIINHQFTDDFTPYNLDIATGLKSGQTSQTKRWPAQDELVTFTAHFINRGTNPIDQFNYQWLLDDNSIKSGTYKGPILPGEKAEISVQWSWDKASHRIKFLAPLKDDLTPSNNVLEDYTDALSFFTFIDRSYDQQFAANTTKVAHPTTSSILEWLQLHIKKLNQMFEQAGATTRVRYDLLEIIDDNASLPSQDRLIMYDGSFPNRFEKGNKDLRLGASAYYDQGEDIDYGLLHELGHQLGLIDLYRLDVSKSQNEVNGESRRAIFGLMDGVSHFISEHSALALNSWQGKRRGYFGQYLYDIPVQNQIKFLEANGNPLTKAKVTVYQKVETEGIGERIPNIPKFQGMTDDNGVYVLPNVPVDDSLFTPTETGNKLRPNPFGYISNHGENGVFLLKIEKCEFTDYKWIDITKFNIAYWKGETKNATYQIKIRLSSQIETKPPPELTEKNAENWAAEASDGLLTTVKDDYTFKQVGEASIKLVTESGGDVCIRYPALTMAEWDLTNKDYLTIWFYSENHNIGFQNSSPWISLGNQKTGGYFQYQTDWDILNDSQGKWCSYKIPLTGDELWRRTKVGEVSLDEINYIEIHADTWDYGFTLWIDGLSFIDFSTVIEPIYKTHCIITASAGPGGTITPSCDVVVNYDSDQTFTITPYTGYHIKEVLVDSSSVGAVPSYTFTNITSNHTIEATFEPLTFTIKATASVGGTILPSDTISVNYGDSKTFTITPNIGYHIKDVKVDGSSVGAVLTHTFTNVTSDHTIEATFEINTYTIQASAGLGGSISPSGIITVNYGDSKTFQIIPDQDYGIKDIIVDGISVGAVSSYIFTNITSNHTIEAIFEEEKKETVIVLQISNKIYTVNGISNTLDSPPVIKNSRTLLPIRAIIESLGGTVGWDATERKVTVLLGSTTLELWIGKSVARVNGKDTPIDSTNSKVVPEIINSRTMLPLRFVTENLDCTVKWDPDTQIITITYLGGQTK